MSEVIHLGNVYNEKLGKGFAGNVWDKNGISPTLTTMQGGGREPMIVEQQEKDMCIVAMHGRKPNNPSDRTPGIHTEQRLEQNSEGLCNTLTTVQKDNLVLENIVIGGMQEHQSIKDDGTCTTLTSSMGTGGGYVPMVVEDETIKIKQATKQGYIDCKIGGVADFSFPDSKLRRGRVQEGGDVCPTLMAGSSEIVKIEKVGQISNEGSQCGTVVSENGLYPTISAGCHGYANPHNTDKYRIRKLTPRECFRLTNVEEEQFNRAEKVVSNSQLYKVAGNAIVVSCLVGLFSQLGIQGKKKWNDMTQEERLKLVHKNTVLEGKI